MHNEVKYLPTKVSLAVVKQVPFFKQLPETLTEYFQLNEWNKGDFIDSNILTQHFFVIMDGQIEAKQANPETGREATLSMLYTGDFFDLIVLLDGQPHDIIISPLTTVRLLSVKLSTMRHWLWTYPEFNKQFMPYLAEKMREQEEQTSSLVLHDVTTRLSRIILKHLNKIKLYSGNSSEEHHHHLINGLNDEALARMAGSVRQVINKKLNFLKEKGVIDRVRNQLMIKDLEALKKEAKYTSNLPKL